MCGIFATNRADRWLPYVGDILRELDHRGPDASGVWHDADSNLLLIHTRLEIVGLGAAGAQPMVKAGRALTYNGEVYNFRELANGSPPASDTELVLDLLSTEGPSAFSKLDGMYALALADPERRELLIARDPQGIKPLYVRKDESGGIAVASTIPPLLCAQPRPAISDAGLLEFLTFGHTTEDHTCWDGITKLPPGTWVRVANHDRAEIQLGRIVPVAQQQLDVEAALEAAVRSQLIADVPVGTFLSGGVDSAAITAIARKYNPDLHAFTVAFPDTPAIDESERAGVNARAIGCYHHVIAATNNDLANAISLLIREAGEPLGDPAICATRILAQGAREQVKVTLTGEGSDEIWGGYLRHRLAYATRHLNPWPSVEPIARVLAERRTDGRIGRIAEFMARGASAKGYAALAAADLAILESASQNGHADLSTQVTAPMKLTWSTARADRKDAMARLYDLRRWLPNTYLEKTDRSTMSAHIEGRVPMLSQVMIDTGLRQKAPSKAPLVDAAMRVVPGLQFTKRKTGLAVPIQAFGAQHGARVSEADQFLFDCFGQSVVDTIRHRASRSPLVWFRLMAVGVFLTEVT